MEYIFENKKNLIIIFLLLVFFILIMVLFKPVKKEIIYTMSSSNGSSLPYININTDDINDINVKLEEEYNLIKELNNNSKMTYEYSINNNILSVLVKKEMYNEKKVLDEIYKTYNIDLKTKKIYNNDDIYNKYNISKDLLDNIILTTLTNKYNDGISNNKFNSDECDLDYYIFEYKGYSGVDDNLNPYIKNNQIYVYLNISDYSPSGIEKINKEYKID